MATTSASAAKAGATNGTTPADVEKQLETIRDDISELTQQVADLIGQAKDNTMAQVKAQARRAKAQADSVLSDAKKPAERRSTRSATWPTRSATRSRIR